jgi:sulfoxide reductase heme-binding subunit YedZ
MKAKARLTKLLIFISSLIPLSWYVWGILTEKLGANPIETITRGLGTWALIFLLLTLTTTPLQRLAKWHWPVANRRMIGLFAFFYACLHFMAYIWLDQFFDWPAIGKDIFKRPFITVGIMTLLLLLPLAITSSTYAVMTLGAKRWKKLHRLIYLISVMACIHYFWMVKADTREPVIYSSILFLLLSTRVFWLYRKIIRPTTR